MKKKFFAVAMATTMALSAAMTASAATADVTIDAAFSANTGEEKLSGDFDVTYSFKVKSNGTNNWDNFILEMRTAGDVGTDAAGAAKPVYIDMRADNFGWLANNKDTTAALTWAEVTSTWDTYNADMKAGVDCTVNVVRKGNTFTATMKEGDKYTFTGTVTCADFEGQDVIMYLTGEKCAITNAKFTNNTKSGEVETKAPAAGGTETKAPAAGETETKAPAAGGTTAGDAATGNKTGDAAPIVALAAVAVLASATVVVSRKKVTE